MTRTKMKSIAVAAFGIAAVVSLGSATSATPTTYAGASIPPVTSPPLASVTQATLASEGIVLDATNQQPAAAASGQEAVSVANGLIPSASVRELALASLTETNNPAVSNAFVWVVSVAPPGGVWSSAPPGFNAQQGSFMLVFVDATTGRYLFSLAGGEV